MAEDEPRDDDGSVPSPTRDDPASAAEPNAPVDLSDAVQGIASDADAREDDCNCAFDAGLRDTRWRDAVRAGLNNLREAVGSAAFEDAVGDDPDIEDYALHGGISSRVEPSFCEPRFAGRGDRLQAEVADALEGCRDETLREAQRAIGAWAQQEAALTECFADWRDASGTCSEPLDAAPTLERCLADYQQARTAADLEIWESVCAQAGRESSSASSDHGDSNCIVSGDGYNITNLNCTDGSIVNCGPSGCTVIEGRTGRVTSNDDSACTITGSGNNLVARNCPGLRIDCDAVGCTITGR